MWLFSMAVLYLVCGRWSYEAVIKRTQTGDAVVVLDTKGEVDRIGRLPPKAGVECWMLEELPGDQKPGWRSLSIEGLVALTERYPILISWEGD